MAGKKRKSGGGGGGRSRPRQRNTSGNNQRVTALVSPRSSGGVSLFAAGEAVSPQSFENYCSSQRDIDDSVRELTRLGFTIESTSEATISISGTVKQFQDVFGHKLVREEVEVAPDQTTTYFTSEEEGDEAVLRPLGDLANLIEGVALSIPCEYFETPIPPIVPLASPMYRYLFAPDELAVLLRAARTHRTGGTGAGVPVAMCDTGFYRHEFYKQHGYRIDATILAAGASDPNSDNNGHGTGEAANVFSAAPDVRLIPIKMGDPVDAIKKAVAAKAKVITNSWGYNIDFPPTTWANLPPYLKGLAQEIQLAVSKGIVVCFAAGNGHFAFPASMPEVIAVGGVHVNFPAMTFEASSYASSFISTIYPGRRVPDVCGFTGKKVTIGGSAKAPSLLLPVQPGCQLDGIAPSTGSNKDGWGIFSGTSAACPQVAGVAALMIGKDPTLTPAKVKQNLIKSARDITTGTTQMGDSATPGPDLATGAGLVDAKWAYILSMGSMVSSFIEAKPDQQQEMVASGLLDSISGDFVSELVETLRSR